MSYHQTLIDPVEQRAGVRDTYTAVASHPHGNYPFHTGRMAAALLGYGRPLIDQLPDRAVESFSGVGNPHAIRPLGFGDNVLELGSGGGLDCFLAAEAVGPTGAVIGVDMTPEMVARARDAAQELGCANVELRDGIVEDLPITDGWADVVIANGVVNLVADKATAFAEAHRALRPGGVIQFTDVANGETLADRAGRRDPWTECIAWSPAIGEWCRMLSEAGFTDISVGPPMDPFAGSGCETEARRFDLHSHYFLASKAW